MSHALCIKGLVFNLACGLLFLSFSHIALGEEPKNNCKQIIENGPYQDKEKQKEYVSCRYKEPIVSTDPKVPKTTEPLRQVENGGLQHLMSYKKMELLGESLKMQSATSWGEYWPTH